MTYGRLTAVDPHPEDPSGEEHAGTQHSVRTIASVGYGVAENINLFLDLPYAYRSQEVHEETVHHRNQIEAAPGDLRFRLNYVGANTTFGPGWRIYGGIGLLLPTGSSYRWNVFSAAADTTRHSHIVTGSGNYQVMLRGEAYYRSEFPVATGVILSSRIPVWNPAEPYFPGYTFTFLWENYLQRLHLWSSIPRVGIVYRTRTPEKWGDQVYPNSGGSEFYLQAGWITELSESLAGLVEIRIPLYSQLSGSQLTGISGGLTVRYQL